MQSNLRFRQKVAAHRVSPESQISDRKLVLYKSGKLPFRIILGIFFVSILFVVYQIFSDSRKDTLRELVQDEKIWEAVKDLPLPDKDFDKLTEEIKGIQSKERKGNPCEQYVIKARFSGFFQCFNCVSGKIYLKEGETWKIGKTCKNENGRYPSGVPDQGLRYFAEFSGTEIQCLIVEKIKIYAYFFSEENQNREVLLELPPGNKIFR